MSNYKVFLAKKWLDFASSRHTLEKSLADFIHGLISTDETGSSGYQKLADVPENIKYDHPIVWSIVTWN